MTPGADQWLRAASDGDAEAWRGLIDAYAGRLYALIYRRCGDRELAEEITQATFVKVVSKLGDYRELGKFEAWLFRIAINGLRDEMRRRKRQALSVDFGGGGQDAASQRSAVPLPLDLVDQEERLALVRRAVASLPEADREILELRYTGELTFAQIAEVLDEPLGTVLARGHRALKKLREMLRDSLMSEG